MKKPYFFVIVLVILSILFISGCEGPTLPVNPNPEDRSITIKLGIAVAGIDVSFHDHIIIGDGYHSMADNGWMKKVGEKFQSFLKES